MKVKKIILSVLLILLVITLAFARPVTLRLSQFLSKSERVNASILVVEGWLPYRDLSAALDEFRSGNYDFMITTGLKATPEYYNVFTDGFLIFYTDKFLPGDNGVTTVAVKAHGEPGGINAPHFKIWVNNSVIAAFTASKRKKLYTTTWNGTHADSVMIQFDNDLVGDFGDRNLYVSKIILNHDTEIPFLNNSVYDILKLDNKDRIINDMTSNAGTTRSRLISMGADPSKVVEVAGNKARINRTLTSALALHDWLKKGNFNVKGINIISSGPHSRRTWMTFNRVLDRDVPVGIVALPYGDPKSDDNVHYLKTARELIAYIWYTIVLTLY
ncbi:MAG TPA: carbohydrate-binding domain-containing protein [Bacteroidales bacterium]|jgi:hypothetical protein|nr:carbohydrate-binding domain-containing protein [Bacteroidales bacterium]